MATTTTDRIGPRSYPAAEPATANAAHNLMGAGEVVIRYGLALVFLWIGMLKFTAYEAQGIEVFVANSPLLSWAYSLLGVRGFSNALGVLEISIGLMIATRAFAPRLSAIGSLLAAGLFLVTLSFLLTTPGVWQAGYGVPFLSPMPGQFLAKDLVFLGASLWTAGEAFHAARQVDRA